ncbi:MAG: LysR family transcriptional regulator [Betaproteobacteria bacterium]|nr:MAG: LysR family transcriptional regulator [Betaproteobacteria bacterium]
MNLVRQRPLSLGSLRAFEAVARRLNFSEAADELHVTQSAISRQIKSLEEELGAPLFARGTRRVELTLDGSTLLRAVVPWLDRLDASVRQIRRARGRRVVPVSTFPSFASLWLIPRMEAFQRAHPDLDIRISANDRMDDLDEPELDVVLRYCGPQTAPAGALRMFGEVLTPVIGPRLADQIRAGSAPPLSSAAHLAEYTLAEEDDYRPSAEFLSWRRWLELHGEPSLQPRRWLYLNYTYQQIQAALAGQGVALARVALVSEQLESGDLIEPFGPAGRITSPFTYWMIVSPASGARDEVAQFCAWIEEHAAQTRSAMGEAG